MQVAPLGLTIPGAVHHVTSVNDTEIHYVTMGDAGTPVLLVHGFPESWWAFHGLIPLLARHHRVIAVDLRGFGDSRPSAPENTSAILAEDLHALVGHLGLGAVHLLAQDISGGIALRLALMHGDDLLSLTGVETGFAGFGLEILADVTRGGAWYIGPLATPNIADAFFGGREKELIGKFLMPLAVVDPQAVSADDVAEFARGYARQGGWSGAGTLYGSMIKEGAELQSLVDRDKLSLPTLAIDRAGSAFTLNSLGAVHSGPVCHAEIAGVGHSIAQEAPTKLAGALVPFFAQVDKRI